MTNYSLTPTDDVLSECQGKEKTENSEEGPIELTPLEIDEDIIYNNGQNSQRLPCCLKASGVILALMSLIWIILKIQPYEYHFSTKTEETQTEAETIFPEIDTTLPPTTETTSRPTTKTTSPPTTQTPSQPTKEAMTPQPTTQTTSPETKSETIYDVLIYRATPAGCAAAIAAGEMGANVILLEPTGHVGGMMTEGGIGLRDGKTETRLHDPRNSQVRWGIQNARYYGIDDGSTIWQPDNSVGEESFLFLLEEAGVKLRLNTNFIEGEAGVLLKKSDTEEGKIIQALKLEGSLSSSTPDLVYAKYFIDASYEGELMQAAGVSYTFGRESSQTYNEPWAGITNHSAAQFPITISPFVNEEGSKQTLLTYIQDGPDPRNHIGEADDSVMSYSYRVCLTKDDNNKVPLTPPEGYNPKDFELSRRLVLAELANNIKLSTPWFNYDYAQYNRIPGNWSKGMKYDACCGFSPFGIDCPGLSVGYANATREERDKIAAKHRYFVQGLMWFWLNDTAVPDYVRDQHAAYGLCKDEWPDNGHFPRQMYVREAVRIVGDQVFTQNDRTDKCRDDSVAVATWFFDIHDVQRVAVKNNDESWIVMNEGLVGGSQDSIKPFDLPYWVLLPKRSEVINLAVPNCPSVTHVAFSAVREEPTLWLLGEAAGTAAVLAVSDDITAFHDVNVTILQEKLKNQGSLLHWPPGRDC